MKREARRQSNLIKMRTHMSEQSNHRAEQEAVREAAKASDMRQAKENEKAPYAEKVKQQKDQERRR